MNIKKTVLVVALLSVVGGLVAVGTNNLTYAQRVSDLPQVAGKDYEEVKIKANFVGLPQKVDGKVLVVDIFNYGCGHCNTMFPLADELYNKYSDKIHLVKISAPFQQWNQYTHLFYTLEKLGVEKEVAPDIFNSIHQIRDRDLSLNSPTLIKILDKHKINKDEFTKAYQDPSIVEKVKQSLKILEAYNVSSTPTIVVNNERVYSPAKNGGYKETSQAVEKGINEYLKEIETSKK